MATVWDIRTGEPVAPPSPSVIRVRGQGQVQGQGPLANKIPIVEVGPLFSPDGRRLFSAPGPTSVQAWTISEDRRPLPELVAAAEALSGRRFREPGSLTLLPADEWRTLLGRVPEATTGSRTPEEEREYHRDRANDCYQVGVLADAIDHLNRLIQLTPGDPKPYDMRGRCWARLGDAKRAVADLNKAIEGGLDHWETWGERGYNHMKLGDTAAALRDFHQLTRFPDAAIPKGMAIPDEWWRVVIMAFAWQGDTKAYRWACARYLATAPNLLGVRNTSTYYYWLVAAPGGLDDYSAVVAHAREQVRQARTARPSPNPDTIASAESRLAVVLYRAGRFAEVISVLEQIDPKAKVGRYYGEGGANALLLALAHHGLGRPDLARKFFEEGYARATSFLKAFPKIHLSIVNPNESFSVPLFVLRREAEAIRGPARTVEQLPAPREVK